MTDLRLRDLDSNNFNKVERDSLDPWIFRDKNSPMVGDFLGRFETVQCSKVMYETWLSFKGNINLHRTPVMLYSLS